MSACAKIAERDPALAPRADRIQHLLPPKVGGVLAILEGAPDADILVIGHTGFDGLRRMSEIWDGVLVGREIRVRIRRTRAQTSRWTPTAAWRGCSTRGSSWTAGSAPSSGRAPRAARQRRTVIVSDFGFETFPAASVTVAVAA